VQYIKMIDTTTPPAQKNISDTIGVTSGDADSE
jgi:hypothetical protein